MKKIVILSLVALMLASTLVLASCGCQQKPTHTTPVSTEATQAPTDEPTTEPTSAPTTQPTAEPTTVPTTASEPISEPTASVEQTTATEPTEPTAEPTSATTEPTAEPTQEPTQESTTTATEPVDSPHTHSWNEGSVTKQATYKESGEITYTCIDCGATKKETLEQLKVEFELVEQRVSKLNWTWFKFYLTLSNGTKEYFDLYYDNICHYWINGHSSQSDEFVVKPDTTGQVKVEYFAKGDDGNYYRYVSSNDYLTPGQLNRSEKPTDTEVLNDVKLYDGYIVVSIYSSKGVDLNYQFKIDIKWDARAEKEDFDYKFYTG